MISTKPIFKRGLLSVAASLIFVSGSLVPLAAYADSTPAPCVAPVSTQPGVHKPIGADAALYVYNCDTGLWDSGHYNYNPSTGVTSPDDPIVYTYNPTTTKYDLVTWVFNAPKAAYVPVTTSVTTPPTGATIVGAPAPTPIILPTSPAPSASSSISGTGPDSNNQINTDGGTLSGSISDTGANSNNTIGGNNTSNTTLNNLSNASLNNLLNSQAGTGNATVLGNTTGGNATSGNAQALANVVNMLQSSSNVLGSGAVTFVANINGDVNGDLMIDPDALAAVQPAAANTPATNNNLTVNNQVNSSIDNNINLAANSGNATVSNNTKGGNATSGSAQAIANVVNLINSAISGGKSFLGVININGNFNGDILMPPSFLDQLIAANVPTVSISTTGPDSNNTITNGQSGNNTTVNNTNNQNINNNVTSQAGSGAANVGYNTSAGNATSGNASTNVTAFNLTGSNVIGKNDLLVFVNVLGKWVGMIVNAPAGTTAAELGGGITTANTVGNNNTTINNTANQSINNNINVAANSGNANVSSNTIGGNATSGNANTAVNLLNISGSNLSLADWFGILFINVFGNWTGSFGVNTSAGDPVLPPASPAATETTTSAHPVFAFVPHSNGSVNVGTSSYYSNDAASSSSNIPPSNVVLAASIKKVNSTIPTPPLSSSHRSFLLPIIGVSLFIVYVILDRFYTLRAAKH